MLEHTEGGHADDWIESVGGNTKQLRDDIAEATKRFLGAGNKIEVVEGPARTVKEIISVYDGFPQTGNKRKIREAKKRKALKMKLKKT